MPILAYTAVMITSAWAWFHMNVETHVSTLTSAYYSVTVNGKHGMQYICPLAVDDIHAFAIKADGTASTGYCAVAIGHQVFRTQQISRGRF